MIPVTKTQLKVQEMLRKLLAASFCILAAAIAGAANRDTAFNKKRLQAMSSDSTLPLVQSRYMKQAPKIDGKISFSEWKDAGAFTGFRNFMTRRLAENDMTVFCAYDDKNLYMLALIPLADDEHISSKYSTRDSAVYRDSSLEILLKPGNLPITQLVINAQGTVFDRKSNDVKWNGKWTIAVGKKIPVQMKKICAIKKGWFIEAALPFSELEATFKNNLPWRFNIAKNGQETLTFAPVKKGFTEADHFAQMVFADSNTPGTALYSIGKPQSGLLSAKGRFLNPSSRKHVFSCDIWAIKRNSYIKDVTGFDQIIGKLQELVKEQTLIPGESRNFTYNRSLDSSELEVIQTLLIIDPLKRPKNIVSRATVPINMSTRVKIDIEHYLSSNYIRLNCDFKGLNEQARNANLKIELIKDKKTLKKFTHKLSGDSYIQKISGLKPGKYTASLNITTPKGKKFSINKKFEIQKRPEWLGNRIGISDKVPRPFTPLTYGQKSISAWGRKYQWGKTMLPSSIKSAGHELLASPAQIVYVINKRKFTVPLGNFKFTRCKPNRIKFAMYGKTKDLTVYVKGWTEFDGLCWYEMTIAPATGKRRFKVEKLYLEFPLKSSEAKYYHAAPNRALNGRIGNEVIKLPFQIYCWAGGVNRGIGFTCESLQNWIIPRGGKTYTYTKEDGKVYWRIHFVQKPVGRKTLKYAFGLQATPVKPLPKDYHSSFTANYSQASKSLFMSYYKDCDFTTAWLSNCNFTKAICAPSTADELLTKTANFCHKLKVPVIPYVAPDSISNNVVPEHDYFAKEWQIRPLRQWKSGTVQTRCCMESSYMDWMLWTMRNMVRKSGVDGLYFDGGFPQPCANSDHGCGWRDYKNRIRYHYPVLKMREFNKRLYIMLDEEVSKRPCPSPLFKYRQDVIPKFFFWEHASGAVAPPVHGFCTALFCGEWFKGAIKRGKTYRELLTLDTFRPRYLSQPWGIPNYFLSIATDSSTGKSIQTEAILAYLLPQGGPLYMRYLNREITDKVLKAKISFNSRAAEFYPAWGTNKHLHFKSSAKDLIMGMWRHKNGKMLVAVGNCTSSEQNAEISIPEAMKAKVIFPEGLNLPSEASKLTFKVKRNSFAMFTLEP